MVMRPDPIPDSAETKKHPVGAKVYWSEPHSDTQWLVLDQLHTDE